VFATFIGLGFGFFAPHNNQTVAQEAALERIQKSGILRCGYALEVPNVMMDPNTHRIYGIAPDIIERAAAMLVKAAGIKPAQANSGKRRALVMLAA